MPQPRNRGTKRSELFGSGSAPMHGWGAERDGAFLGGARRGPSQSWVPGLAYRRGAGGRIASWLWAGGLCCPVPNQAVAIAGCGGPTYRLARAATRRTPAGRLCQRRTMKCHQSPRLGKMDWQYHNVL